MDTEKTERDSGGGAGGVARAHDPYRELFERSADAILIIRGETFVDCNQAAVKMLGYETRVEVLSTHPSELSPPDQPDGRESFEKANEMIAVAFEKGSHRFEWDHRRANGEVFPVEVLLTAVQGGDEPIPHVVWRDITERKQLEEHLRQSQKMEAIGKLAGGIAHDFNNLLVAILGNGELLERRLKDSPELAGMVGEIRYAGERAAALVRQLLTFSHRRDLMPRIVDLNASIEGVHTLLTRLIGEDIQLVTVIADESVRVKIDPVQVEQILINLATNARDAMPAGGVLTMEVKRLLVVGDVIGTGQQLEPGPYALIAVSDTGLGMDEATSQKIFDPFFTTKGLGHGTGLGLSTVYGIARQCGGTVSVYSSVGHGTTMKVYLPITLQEVMQSPSLEKLPAKGGEETILVAEDDPSVSNLVVRVLREKGYQVLLARDGREALAMWERHPQQIDLLFTDVVMPRMGGPELVQTLRTKDHFPRVLFASGYTNNALDALRAIEDGVDLLEKPYSAAELAQRIRAALDRGAAEGS